MPGLIDDTYSCLPAISPPALADFEPHFSINDGQVTTGTGCNRCLVGIDHHADQIGQIRPGGGWRAAPTQSPARVRQRPLRLRPLRAVSCHCPQSRSACDSKRSIGRHILLRPWADCWSWIGPWPSSGSATPLTGASIPGGRTRGDGEVCWIRHHVAKLWRNLNRSAIALEIQRPIASTSFINSSRLNKSHLSLNSATLLRNTEYQTLFRVFVGGEYFTLCDTTLLGMT